MPAKKQFKFGITCEFKPLWDEFENLSPSVWVEQPEGDFVRKPNKISKMIRYLIYNFLYNNGNRTRNTFPLIFNWDGFTIIRESFVWLLPGRGVA